MSDLVYAADTWKAWSSLGEGERKLRAAKAIQQEDHDELWLMTLAYLQFKGRKGTSISPHTLRAYRRGMVDYRFRQLILDRAVASHESLLWSLLSQAF